MALSLSQLRSSGTRYDTLKVSMTKSLTEARQLHIKTAFLCHSHLDKDAAEGLVVALAAEGCDLYVDWTDTTMPSSPNRTTAARIQAKIIESDLFLFLATANSMKSRWCPWELGYADGKKNTDRIVVIPTEDAGVTVGNEYIQLYRRLDRSDRNQLGVWRPHETTGILAKLAF
jgi:hypothetical protein